MSDGTDVAPSVRLRVQTAPSAEILLSDSGLQPIASAVETLDTLQAPGVYKLAVRQGRTTEEQIVLLERDTDLEIAAPELASPIPLAGTRRSHDFHRDAAVECSRTVHWRFSGSMRSDATIFIQSRYWTGATAATKATSYAPPAAGLSLARLDASERVDLGKAAVSGIGPEWDPSAACTVAVAPGAYVLAATTPSGSRVEQVIYAAQGWQTQVFVLRQRQAAGGSELADLFDLAITMSRGSYQDSVEVGLCELARIALADERTLLSGELDRLLRGECANPMLGILGAHLMLQRAGDADPGLFDHVVKTLREQVGRAHPDVEALSLRMSKAADRSTRPLLVPPMLRRSWSLLVQASADYASLVPVVLWKRIARMTSSRPFLSWFASQAGVDLDPELAQALRHHLRGHAASQPPASHGAALLGGVPFGPAPLREDETRLVAQDLELPASAVHWLKST